MVIGCILRTAGSSYLKLCTTSSILVRVSQLSPWPSVVAGFTDNVIKRNNTTSDSIFHMSDTHTEVNIYEILKAVCS